MMHYWIVGMLVVVASCALATPVWDPHGYVLYCPCMGRLGNQMDQFLGTLEFAKQLNRTLILPNHIDFNKAGRGAYPSDAFAPWDRYFDPARVNEYHKAILTPDFFNAFQVEWPPEQRKFMCYQPRGDAACDCRRGQPSESYWDKMSEYTNAPVVPALTETYTRSMSDYPSWRRHTPASTTPVLWLFGAPGKFPVPRHLRRLQRFVQWMPKLTRKALFYIRRKLPRPFVGVHLRNGIDWERACGHAVDAPSYMESPQCMDGSAPHITHPSKVSAALCLPDPKQVVRDTVAAVVAVQAKAVFIATDKHDYVDKFVSALKKKRTGLDWDVAVVRYKGGKGRTAGGDLDDELPVLELADVFVGSCVSSITGLVSRRRAALAAEHAEAQTDVDVGVGVLPDYPTTYFAVETDTEALFEKVNAFYAKDDQVKDEL